MVSRQHWETVYSTKPAESVSWYQEHANTSLSLINSLGLTKDSSIIDVGGGASTLIDDLLLDGYLDLTVLDLSETALELSKERLGSHAHNVNWIAEDIMQADFNNQYFDLWHDRAVFHFLTDESKRQAYIEKLEQSLKPNGHIIMATFAKDGPDKCSGLPVVQYSEQTLSKTLGERFLLKNHCYTIHYTPLNTTQNFIFCHFVKRA